MNRVDDVISAWRAQQRRAAPIGAIIVIAAIAAITAIYFVWENAHALQ